MKHLQTYRLFESQQELTPEQVDFLDARVRGGWKVNVETGLVDIVGSFVHHGGKLEGKLDDFKGIRFGSVSGDFNCPYNNLTSLEGAPQYVGRDFDCSGNQLTSLKGAPRQVGGNFYLSDETDPDILGGNWTPEGWLKAAQEKNPIYLTLLSAEKINDLIKKDSNKWLEVIKPYLNDPDSQEWVSKLDLSDFDGDSLDTYGTLGSLGI